MAVPPWVRRRSSCERFAVRRRWTSSTSSSAYSRARSSGVAPAELHSTGLAPDSIRNSAVAASPSRAATCSGEFPSAERASTSAPCSTSTLAVSTWPMLTAQCSAVVFSSLRADDMAPCESISRTRSVSPRKAAVVKSSSDRTMFIVLELQVWPMPTAPCHTSSAEVPERDAFHCKMTNPKSFHGPVLS